MTLLFMVMSLLSAFGGTFIVEQFPIIKVSQREPSCYIVFPPVESQNFYLYNQDDSHSIENHGSTSDAVYNSGNQKKTYQIYFVESTKDSYHHIAISRKFSRLRGLWLLSDSLELRYTIFPYCNIQAAKSFISTELPKQSKPFRRAWVAILVEYSLYYHLVDEVDFEQLIPYAKKCVNRRNCTMFFETAFKESASPDG